MVFECLEMFLFLLVELFGYVDTDVHDNVALSVTISLNSRQALSAQAKCRARLGTRFYLDARLACKGRHFDHIAQGGLRNSEKQVVDQIVLVAQEVGVGKFFDYHLYVAWYAIVLACMALTLDIEYHAFGNTGGNVDFYDFLASRDALSMTMRTLFLDNHSLAMAVWTNLL